MNALPVNEHLVTLDLSQSPIPDPPRKCEHIDFKRCSRLRCPAKRQWMEWRDQMRSLGHNIPTSKSDSSPSSPKTPPMDQQGPFTPVTEGGHVAADDRTTLLDFADIIMASGVGGSTDLLADDDQDDIGEDIRVLNPEDESTIIEETQNIVEAVIRENMVTGLVDSIESASSERAKATSDAIPAIGVSNFAPLVSTPLPEPTPPVRTVRPTKMTAIVAHNWAAAASVVSVPTTPVTPTTRERPVRSIKRRKFDDELVESSLNTTPQVKVLSREHSHATRAQRPEPIPEIVHSPPALPNVPSPLPPVPDKKKKNLGKKKTVDIGQILYKQKMFEPSDDYALLLNVHQCADIEGVHLCVKFSSPFTVEQLKQRYQLLMFDPLHYKNSMATIVQLDPCVKWSIMRKAMFSDEEEEALAKIPSTKQVDLSVFRDLLSSPTGGISGVFLPTRTPKHLLQHWTLMKNNHLLNDQTVPTKQRDPILEFSDVEDSLDDAELLKQPPDPVNIKAMESCYTRLLVEMRRLEAEVQSLVNLTNPFTHIPTSDFDSQTLAVLKGRQVRYLMRSREVTIGRMAKNNEVDVDLLLEGPVNKVSRRQGVIKLNDLGRFFIYNEGKLPFYVNGHPVIKGSAFQMDNNCVLEIANLRFVFQINEEYVKQFHVQSLRDVTITPAMRQVSVT